MYLQRSARLQQRSPRRRPSSLSKVLPVNWLEIEIFRSQPLPASLLRRMLRPLLLWLHPLP
jgi:hypothetical protein